MKKYLRSYRGLITVISLLILAVFIILLITALHYRQIQFLQLYLLFSLVIIVFFALVLVRVKVREIFRPSILYCTELWFVRQGRTHKEPQRAQREHYLQTTGSYRRCRSQPVSFVLRKIGVSQTIKLYLIFQ